MKHILVTGGAGFIGSHTVDLLLQQGMQVVVLDDLSSGKLSNLPIFHPNLRFVQADILDYKALLPEVCRADAVLHLAALPSVTQSIENPVHSLKINTLGFLHILQAIRESERSIRLVYASSAAIYGEPASFPCSDETHLTFIPLSPYALEKANNERYAKLNADLFGINSLGLRYFNVYGERQHPSSPYSGVISKFLEQYKNQEPMNVFGNGEQARDFISVLDVAKANYLALQSDYRGVLNIATGVPENLNQLIQYIENVGNRKAKVAYFPTREGDIQTSYACTLKAEACIEFKYKIPLIEGIGELLKNS